MTDEELELKAKESFNNKLQKDVCYCTYNEEKIYKDGYLAGVEFGYNKVNEWHFIKDGDLPKENQLVLLYRENLNGANISLTHWYKSYANDKVIAWKEVIPPNEKE